MEKITCNGKCQECEALENGMIENAEVCAIFATQRRTFELIQKVGKMERMIEKLLENSAVSSTALPVETSDNFNPKTEK